MKYTLLSAAFLVALSLTAVPVLADEPFPNSDMELVADPPTGQLKTEQITGSSKVSCYCSCSFSKQNPLICGGGSIVIDVYISLITPCTNNNRPNCTLDCAALDTTSTTRTPPLGTFLTPCDTLKKQINDHNDDIVKKGKSGKI